MLGLGISRVRNRLDEKVSAPRVAPVPVTLGEGDDERLLPAAAKLAEHAHGGRVLVVAAGSGGPAAAAARRSGHVVAVEADPELRERGQARLPEVEWHAGRARRLPFESASFDAVLAFFGATYEPDQRAVARELARMALPGAPVAVAAWAGDAARRVSALQPAGGPRPGNWSRYETAYRHFHDFDGLDVVEHALPDGDAFAIVAGRRPGG